MTGRIILILFVFSINFNTFVFADDTSCVVDLPSFIAAFRSNETSTDNILKIQQTFYPQNKPTPHFVVVHYCYEEPCNNSDTANYTYVWTDNPIFFVVDYYLFSSLTFKLASLGDIGEQSFVVPVPCNNNTNKDLLLALTSQLKSIGGTDKTFYYAHHFDVNKQQDNSPIDDYDGAKIVIMLLLQAITLACIIVIHYFMRFKENRKSLGKFVKRFVQKYMPTNNEEYSQISESENDEVILSFFIKGAIFPMMATAVVGVTIVDLYFFSIAAKYHKTSSNIGNFLILFPLPIVAFIFFIFNIFLTRMTLRALGSLRSSSWDFLITLTLLLLFGIVYPVYHGFWIMIALLAYPGRILIGGVFVVPFLLATIPTWNIIMNVIENWRRCCCKKNGNCCCCYCEDEELSCLLGCKFFLLLIVAIIFWGLFIGTLIYISRFLLGSSVNLETNKFQSSVFFAVISAVSGILTWLNTDLTKRIKNNPSMNRRRTNQANRNDQESMV